MKRSAILMALPLMMIIGCKGEVESVRVDKTVNVHTANVVEQAYAPKLLFSGTLYANQEANIGASLPGRIERMVIDEGQSVCKGGLIAELSGEFLTQARAEYMTYEKDFQRVERLVEKGSLPQQKLDHIKAKYEATKAKYEMVKRSTEIRAPFAGVVVEHMINEGENFSIINPGLVPGFSHASGIVRLMDLDHLKVEIEVNERDIRNVHVGQVAEVRCDAYPDSVITGKVAAIQPIVSTVSRGVKVDVALNNQSRLLMPGMFANVALEMPERNVVMIPRSAIIHQPGTGTYIVFVTDGKTAERREIVKGDMVYDYVIVEGVQTMEQVVTDGKNKLRDGLKVNVQK